MDPVVQSKLSTNVANSYKMASMQATAIVSAAVSIFLAMPDNLQQVILSHIPVPSWVLPILAWGVTYVARVWPQASITPQVAEAKSGSSLP